MHESLHWMSKEALSCKDALCSSQVALRGINTLEGKPRDTTGSGRREKARQNGDTYMFILCNGTFPTVAETASCLLTSILLFRIEI